jgi:hypothetical protein
VKRRTGNVEGRKRIYRRKGLYGEKVGTGEASKKEE